MQKKRFIVLVVLLTLSLNRLLAMNVKSLEIAYEGLGGLSYKSFAVFYLYDPSPIDKTIEFNWGDSYSSQLSIQSVTDLPGELKKVVYSGSHTYSGPATFVAFVSYSVRSTNVQNVNYSLVTDIYSQAEIVVSPFLGETKSPVFIEPPRLNVCVDTVSLMNFLAYDADGDVLKYSLVNCRGNNGSTIDSYLLPAATSSFTIDANSGLLTWISPTKKGFYNYAVKVDKYRNGVFVGSVMRDALVNVIDCSLLKPTLKSPADTCILVNASYVDTVEATYSGSDTIALSVFGEPLFVNPKIELTSPISGKSKVVVPLMWNVSCSQVRLNPYKLYYSAELEDSLNNCDCVYTFNNQKITPFRSNVPVKFNNPCSDGWDNSYYLWFGADSSAPRYLVSPPINVSDGNYMVVFDMRMEEHTGEPGTDCEGPDEPAEGIYLQYCTNGFNGPWVSMAYWDPSISPNEGGHVKNLIEWNNYSIAVPDAAYSPNTRFRWVQFEATNYFYDHWGLDNIMFYKVSDKKNVIAEQNISVICPAPENLTASAVDNSVSLNWNDCICSNATGYKVYRKSSFYGYVPNTCETGVPEYTGYSLIATVDSVSNSCFVDNNNGLGLPNGNTYCYMVVAFFANGAESQASNEVCVTFPDVAPVITNVSIRETDLFSGSTFVAWSKPDSLDLSVFAGPYKYEVYRAETFSTDFSLVGSTYGINDTIFIDTAFNTETSSWKYFVNMMYANGTENYQLAAKSYPATSVFLKINPLDKSLLLDWSFDVPWINEGFVVYRNNETTHSFDSLAYTTEKSYLDTNLVNGKSYCYFVKSVGKYSLPGFVFPIENMSQKVCASPVDIEPPCDVVLSVSSNCDSVHNLLLWSNPANICGDADVSRYEIYFSQLPNSEMQLLSIRNNVKDTFFIHENINSVVGCYAVLSVDSNENKSNLSNKVCIDLDICELYKLPNVFTPNGDGNNDLFRPFPFDFVEKVDMTIFNRWGTMVFKTDNPDVNWDGKDMLSGNDCSEGVYFYVCDVYELTLSGLNKRTLSGTVHLYRK